MAHWYRTREIKPGVYETQSVGTHVGIHMGIAAAVIVGVALAVLALFGLGYALLDGDVEFALKMLLLAGVVLGIPYWHYRHHKSRPEQPSRPGPWDD